MINLSKNAQKHFDGIKSFLVANKIYDPIDDHEITRLAIAMDLNEKALKAITKLDLSNPDKAFTQSSTYNIYKESSSTIRVLTQKFGMNPDSRHKMKMKVQAKVEDPLMKLVSKKAG